MKNLPLFPVAVLFLVFIFINSPCEAYASDIILKRDPEKALFGRALNKKKAKKVKESRKVVKAKKEQEARLKERKKEYAESVKASRKRSYEIQSPEVKERMNQNEKDTALMEKAKQKRIKKGSKTAAKKYK